jgi:D-cysteine desulfhydrase family pyridoxal phosphate-dependent enzyme
MPLANQPRHSLAALPTPLHELPRLREALGGPHRCPRILIKRDDLTGLAFGGNKARKLEFLVGDALTQGATCLVTTGAVQSNHARLTAAAARTAGMKAALVLTSDCDSPPLQGNLLLDHLLGAEVHFVPEGQETAKMAEVAQALQQRGERPYVIPIGGSSPIGALGYAAGTLELTRQLTDRRCSPSQLFYASGSRGTQAGLALGAKLYHVPYQLQGIAVSPGEPEKIQRAKRIANEAAAIIGVPPPVTEADLLTDQNYLGSGYGFSTAGSTEAIGLLARTEGIFLDPVYTAKAMAGMIDYVRQGRIAPTETILFLHTGGTPALFAHADDFRTQAVGERMNSPA